MFSIYKPTAEPSEKHEGREISPGSEFEMDGGQEKRTEMPASAAPPSA